MNERLCPKFQLQWKYIIIFARCACLSAAARNISQQHHLGRLLRLTGGHLGFVLFCCIIRISIFLSFSIYTSARSCDYHNNLHLALRCGELCFGWLSMHSLHRGAHVKLEFVTRLCLLYIATCVYIAMGLHSQHSFYTSNIVRYLQFSSSPMWGLNQSLFVFLKKLFDKAIVLVCRQSLGLSNFQTLLFG